jgi:hypothetical protein
MDYDVIIYSVMPDQGGTVNVACAVEIRVSNKAYCIVRSMVECYDDNGNDWLDFIDVVFVCPVEIVEPSLKSVMDLGNAVPVFSERRELNQYYRLGNWTGKTEVPFKLLILEDAIVLPYQSGNLIITKIEGSYLRVEYMMH